MEIISFFLLFFIDFRVLVIFFPQTTLAVQQF